MVGQNTQNKAASKNADNAHATALGDVQNSTNQAVSRMDALYKGTPNPLAGMHAPTGPQQHGGGQMGGGIMGQGGRMQGAPQPTPPPQPAMGPDNAGLQKMIAQFMQGQQGGGAPPQAAPQGGGMGAMSRLMPLLQQMMQGQGQQAKPPSAGAAPPPMVPPFNRTPPMEAPAPNPFGNPQLPMHPAIGGRRMQIDF